MNDLLDFRSVDDRVRGEQPPSAVKSVRVAKLELIRVAREENLRKIFPATIEPGPQLPLPDFRRHRRPVVFVCVTRTLRAIPEVLCVHLDNVTRGLPAD